MALSFLKKAQDKQNAIQRHEEFHAFQTIMDNVGIHKKQVISYYGIGGIGKSTLRSQITTSLKETYYKKVVSINFNDFTLLEVEDLLLFIRNELTKKYDIPFYYFDVGYLIYLNKRGKKGDYDTGTFSKLEATSELSDLLATTVGVPFISLLPKIVLMAEKRNLRHHYKEFERELSILNSMDIEDVFASLFELLCHDIQIYQDRTQEVIVFIFDTYEKLWTNKSFGAQTSADKYIRELFHHLEETLWIIFGREKVRWKPDLSYQLTTIKLDSFNLNETRRVLHGHGIEDDTIIVALHNKTKGHPLSLEAAIKLLESSDKKLHHLTLDDLQDISTINHTFERMVDHLSPDQLQTFEYLAMSNGWDEKLFTELLRHFELRMNQDDLDELMDFAFIRYENGYYFMHDVMKEHMLQMIGNKKKRTRGYTFLHEYYRNQISEELLIKSPEVGCSLLEKAIPYGFELYDCLDDESRDPFLNDFIDWFRDSDRTSLQKSESHLLLPLHDRFYKLFTERQDFIRATICEYDIAYIYLQKVRDYKVSKKMFSKILEDRRTHLGEQHSLTGKAYYGFGLYYTVTRELEWAIDYQLKGYHIRKSHEGVDPISVAISASGLGYTYMELRQWKTAVPYLQDAIRIRKQINDPKEKFNIVNSLLNYAFTLLHLQKPEEAVQMASDALALLAQHNVLDTEHAIRGYRYRALAFALQAKVTETDEDLLLAEQIIEHYHPNTKEFEYAKWFHSKGMAKWILSETELAESLLHESLRIKQALMNENKLTGNHWSYIETLEMIQSLQDSPSLPAQLHYQR